MATNDALPLLASWRRFVYALAVALLVGLFVGHFVWRVGASVQYVTRYRALWHTVTRSDTVYREHLRMDTVRLERIVTLRDTAHVLMARADSLPPDSAVPMLRRACFALDSALTTCGERVAFWHGRASEVTAQRDSALELARDAIAHLRPPGRFSLGVAGGYGLRGPDVLIGVSFRLF